MKTISETQNFLNSLNKLTFIDSDGQSFTTLEGFIVSYEFNIMEVTNKSYPVQILFYVKKDGAHVLTWGCYSNECNTFAGAWILKIKSKVRDEKNSVQDEKKAIAKALFNELIK
jgi:hypothetical protein